VVTMLGRGIRRQMLVCEKRVGYEDFKALGGTGTANVSLRRAQPSHTPYTCIQPTVVSIGIYRRFANGHCLVRKPDISSTRRGRGIAIELSNKLFFGDPLGNARIESIMVVSVTAQ